MANLREATAISMDATNLGGRADGGESHADRIGALAMSDRLAALLWHLKYNNDRKAYKPALWLVVKAIRSRSITKRWKHCYDGVIEAMCEQVLQEWLSDFCLDCQGRGIIGGDVTHNTVRKSCAACTGEGFTLSHRYCHFPKGGEIPEGGVRHKCNACCGMGYTLEEPKNKPAKMGLCPTCKGQPRIRKISWAERVRALGIPADSYSRWERRFDEVMDFIGGVDRRCNVTMNIQLERFENG